MSPAHSANDDNHEPPSPARRKGWLRSFRTQVALGFGGLAAVLAVTLSLVLGSMFAR